MLGFKITATYTPDNTALTPDPTLGTWGDAASAWTQAAVITFDAGALQNVLPDNMPSSTFVDYVNTSDSRGPAFRVVLIWDIGAQDPFDLAAVQAALEAAAADSTSIATMSAFDSVGSMSYDSALVEQWSDEEPI